MQVNFHQKNLHLNEEQKEYISEKLLTLKKFRFLEDPSATAKVDVEYFENASSSDKIQMSVVLSIPGKTMRAETAALTVEAAVDDLEDKLRHQLERYKTEHE